MILKNHRHDFFYYAFRRPHPGLVSLQNQQQQLQHHQQQQQQHQQQQGQQQHKAVERLKPTSRAPLPAPQKFLPPGYETFKGKALNKSIFENFPPSSPFLL